MAPGPYKILRCRYEASIARAKLELAEDVEDNDETTAAINERWDERDAAIFDEMKVLGEPETKDEVYELMQFTAVYLDRHAHLTLDYDRIGFVAELVKRARWALINIEGDARRASRNAA